MRLTILKKRMWHNSRMIIACVVTCAAIGPAALSTRAAIITPIIKLNLGADGNPDVQFEAGVFSTTDDGETGTTGNQNTDVEFVDFLDSVATDVLTPDASFSLNDLMVSGLSTTYNGILVVQVFTQGSFSLHAPDNTLLLSGELTMSALTWSSSPPNQAVQFVGFAHATDGLLAQYLDRDSLRLKMTLPTIIGGVGLSVNPPPGAPPPSIHYGELVSFTSIATVEILAAPIPEPSSVALLLMGGGLISAAARRKRHG